MADRHPRAIMLAGILVWAWLVLTLSGTGFAEAVTTMGDLACEADTGDSNYGEMQWSFAPPGPHCVWTDEINGFAASTRPSPIWSAWLMTVVVLGCLTARQLAVALRTRTPRRTTQPQRSIAP